MVLTEAMRVQFERSPVAQCASDCGVPVAAKFDCSNYPAKIPQASRAGRVIVDYTLYKILRWPLDAVVVFITVQNTSYTDIQHGSSK
jgi:hypothetical protein